MWIGRPGWLLLGLALLLGTLTGCGEEVPAEPPVGKVERTDSIIATNLVLVTNGRGVARMVGTLVNEADREDRLVGLDIAADVGEYSVTFADGPIRLPPDEPVQLTRDARVIIVSDTLRPGFRADVRLAFRNSETITTTVPVEPQEGAYEEVEVTRPQDGDISPD